MDELKLPLTPFTDTDDSARFDKINEIVRWINAQGPIRGDKDIESYIKGEEDSGTDD